MIEPKTGTNKNDIPTAAVLLIGDELLSGRTADKNLVFLARALFALGIDLKEARVISDTEEEIVSAIQALRSRYTYVFTTGGIGPTHDDITTDSVALAFGVPVVHHPEAVAILERYLKENGREVNDSRLRMARIPVGARLICTDRSAAPGFALENVYVMAGIPDVMIGMFESLAPTLRGAAQMGSVTITILAGEGDLAAALRAIQERFAPKVIIGSYPFLEQGRYATHIVARSRDLIALQNTHDEIYAMGKDLFDRGLAFGLPRE